MGWNSVAVTCVGSGTPPREVPALDYLATLSDGWLIALDWDAGAQSWHAIEPSTKSTFRMGHGYWVYSAGDGVIVPWWGQGPQPSAVKQNARQSQPER